MVANRAKKGTKGALVRRLRCGQQKSHTLSVDLNAISRDDVAEERQGLGARERLLPVDADAVAPERLQHRCRSRVMRGPRRRVYHDVIEVHLDSFQPCQDRGHHALKTWSSAGQAEIDPGETVQTLVGNECGERATVGVQL